MMMKSGHSIRAILRALCHRPVVPGIWGDRVERGLDSFHHRLCSAQPFGFLVSTAQGDIIQNARMGHGKCAFSVLTGSKYPVQTG